MGFGRELVSLSLRAEAPFDGRFDYDVDGRLVGNWFLQGTNGYEGVNRDRYWAGHLAVAYDHLDPSHVVISLGTFDGASAQVAVRGNAPDPADISVIVGAGRLRTRGLRVLGRRRAMGSRESGLGPRGPQPGL